jgi:hypothetical protein
MLKDAAKVKPFWKGASSLEMVMMPEKIELK